jgi:hypothetical protein
MSEAALMLLAPALIVWAGAPRGKRSRAPALWCSWAAFAVLTAVFGWSAAPFLDPRYLGHEARETLTHGLVTVPLAVAVCLWMTGGGVRRAGTAGAWWALGGFAALAAYQAVGAVLTGSRARAQTNDLVSLVCVHFFEHALSYLVVATHAALFYGLAVRRGAQASGGIGP